MAKRLVNVPQFPHTEGRADKFLFKVGGEAVVARETNDIWKNSASYFVRFAAKGNPEAEEAAEEARKLLDGLSYTSSFGKDWRRVKPRVDVKQHLESVYIEISADNYAANRNIEVIEKLWSIAEELRKRYEYDVASVMRL